MRNRIESLDYLRGIAAVIVMIGHYYNWLVGPLSAQDILIRLVTYSVCIFYILSGLTLYVVYKNSFRLNLESFLFYGIKRVFRILPLLYFCIFLTLLYQPWPHWKIIFLNLTGTFGFTSYTKGIAIASWSIGVELFFYTVFPIFILLLAYKKILLYWVLVLLTFIIGGYYAFNLLDENANILSQWDLYYIKPLNHLYLFAGGISLGYMLNKPPYFPQWMIKFGILLCVLFFAFYPTTDNLSQMIAGINRVFFVAISFIVCLLFSISNWVLPKWIRQSLHFLGEKSYSIYLLHPIIFQFYQNSYFSNSLKYILCVVTSMLSSYIVFHLLEKPSMEYSKRLVEILKAKPEIMIPKL